MSDRQSIDPVELSQNLIRCPSVTPEDAGALDVLRIALEDLGFVCHDLIFSDDNTPTVRNMYARLGTKSPNFCFAGHTDVVPVGDEAAWSVDPFAGEIQDGILFGRGASDMKSAVAAFAAAASRVIAGDEFDGSISLLITGDEEGPAINGTRKVLEWMAERGETIDICLVGEPTNPTKLGEMVKIGRRGSLSGWLTVNGAQGHTAYPHLADNPIPRMVQMLRHLTESELDQGNDHFQASTIAMTTIDVGNPATNVSPAQVKSTFNIRFNDMHTCASLETWLRAGFDAVSENYELKLHCSGESFLTPPGLLSELISEAVEQHLGITPELSTTGGTSDARFIKDYCPVAEFGLVGQTMHKVDERVRVEDIETLTNIYTSILTKYFDRSVTPE
jgi:succinyl-diaminopimelate desuccinylase